MKIVFYFYSSFPGTMLGILLDEAKKLAKKDKNNQVFFVMCEGFLDHCMSNPTGNDAICRFCKLRAKQILSSTLGDSVQILHLEEFRSQIDYEKLYFEYSNANELKEINYKNIPIGYPTLSSYVSLTRNHDPQIDKNSKLYFNTQLKQAAKLTDAFENLLVALKPDKVCTFNGRYNEVRPVFEVSRKKNIEVNLYEMVPEFDGTFNKVVFNNAMPHDIKDNLWRIDKCWNADDINEEKKIELGKVFFDRRRNGEVAGDKVYTTKQNKSLLPLNFDNDKRNIAIFNSSEDEFVAIGGEYVSKSLFENQIQGLKFLFEKFKNHNEYHFYLRIHPNLNNVDYNYHISLYDFESKYSNVTVIKPDSPLSSYRLLDECEKVIVFGSTIGLEAVYWGKPVILLTCCPYYYADICHIPKTQADLIELIEKNIWGKYNDEVIKLGYYYYNKQALYLDKENQYKYINYNPYQIKLFGRTINGYKYQKLLGSNLLMTLLINAIRYFLSVVFNGAYKMPVNDRK